MRLFTICLALMLTLMASTCSKAVKSPQATDDFIAKVQATAQNLCKFVPTVATITNIVGAATGTSAVTVTATSVASQICSAVQPSSAQALVSGKPTVKVGDKEIAVEGWRVP